MMNSIELGSAVHSDACATELQHAAHVKEKNRNNSKKTMLPAIDLFPSVFQFDHANQLNMSSLLENMKCIKSNISSNINDCYEKPVKAALLKESIHQALSWVLMSYRNLPKGENSSAYLESMSDLLAMYIDMELRASKRGQEQFSAISTRLICCLYTYLDNSPDYMVDTLIKIRHMSHLFHIILDPIMAKILKNIPSLPKPEIVYVRYLLGFRLWKMINSDLVGKKQIRQTAISLLGTAPANLPDFLTNYYGANGSGSQIRSTQFLMKHKFDVKACCADFINFCKREAENCSRADDKMNCLERVQVPQQQEQSDVVAKESSSIKKICSLSEKVVIDPKSCASLVESSDASDKSNLSSNLSRVSINDTTSVSTKESIQSIRPLARRKVKKSSDIIIIDITDEDSAPKVTRKKNRKLIPWLENVKKQNLQRLNAEKKGKKDDLIQKMKSPAKEILKFFLMVTEDSEQKKIESNLYSSFNAWIPFKKPVPATDFYQFFDEEASENSSSSFTAEETMMISSPTVADLSTKSVLNSERLNSSNSENSDELLTDNAESQSLTKREISTVSRFDKTDCQAEADSMICNSDENNFETNAVCEGMSIMVLNENPVDSQSDANQMNHQLSGNCESASFDERVEVPNREVESDQTSFIPMDCSSKVLDAERMSNVVHSPSFLHRPPNPLASSNVLDSSSNIQEALNTLESSTNFHNTSANFNLNFLDRPSNFLNHSSASDPSSNLAERPSNIVDSYFHDPSTVLDYTLPKVKSNIPGNVENSCPTIDTSAEYSFQDSQFQENADALSVLASVCAAQKGNSPSKTIKVRDYARWKPASNPEMDPKALYQFPENPDVMSRIVNVYPEDAFDKVALQVEVISTSDGLTDNTSQSFRETSNVILNGETVVLMQKSPNSNVYVINKATENKNSDDEAIDDAEKSELPPESESQLKGSIKTEVDEKILELKKDKRKNCRQNVKQEFVNCTCGIPDCSILANDLKNSSIPLPTLYTNFPANPELCVPYHKHCASVPLTLPINPPANLHPNTNSTCAIPRCTCLACTYEVVTHCHQYIYPNPEPTSYIDNNSYYIPQQTSAVQEHERTKNPRIANLYDDQLRCKMESKPLEDISLKFKPEVKYQREINNKLPLKKRLKPVQKPYDMSIRSVNYPATPIIGRIDLEPNMTPPEIGATVELTTAKDDSSSPIENRHHDIRRDYRNELHYHYHQHELEKIPDSSKDQRRLVNSQLSNVPHYDSRYQRDVKNAKARAVSPLKQLSPSPQEQSSKKSRRSTTRQTRSSSRKRTRVNYNYGPDEFEKFPPAPKRRRKRTGR